MIKCRCESNKLAGVIIKLIGMNLTICLKLIRYSVELRLTALGYEYFLNHQRKNQFFPPIIEQSILIYLSINSQYQSRIYRVVEVIFLAFQLTFHLTILCSL